MVGAPSPTGTGLFYQWGDTVGHSLAEGYEFSINNYNEKGLNLISSDLDDAHDAARAYYGPEAKMPSSTQLEELKNNCVISNQGNGIYLFRSNINGRSIKIRGFGYINGLEHGLTDRIRAWSKSIQSETLAWSIHVDSAIPTIYSNARNLGFNVMAVHS